MYVCCVSLRRTLYLEVSPQPVCHWSWDEHHHRRCVTVHSGNPATSGGAWTMTVPITPELLAVQSSPNTFCSGPASQMSHTSSWRCPDRICGLVVFLTYHMPVGLWCHQRLSLACCHAVGHGVRFSSMGVRCSKLPTPYGPLWPVHGMATDPLGTDPLGMATDPLAADPLAADPLGMATDPLGADPLGINNGSAFSPARPDDLSGSWCEWLTHSVVHVARIILPCGDIGTI